MATHLLDDMKWPKSKEVGRATDRSRSRTLAGYVAVLSGLTVVFLLTSVTSPPVAYATFPGGNGKIVFASNRDGDVDIFTMNADGSALAQLTTNSFVQDRLPAWSSDGTKIAYSSTQDGGDFDIWVMNADESGKTQLTFNSSEDLSPHWSPDGTKIIFDSNLSGDYEIFVMNADGSGQTPLTSNAVDDNDAAWSPDGTKIAFQRFGADFDIWVMNADGSGQTQLTATAHRDTSVSWAPDGSLLLFRRDFGFGAGWGEVMRMNPDGTGVTNLTNTATIFEDQGSFSPDSTKIVMFSNEGDLSGSQGEILVMNPDGTGRTNLTIASGYDSDPDWQPLPIIKVDIDIKPGSDPNSINPKSKGKIPVAILTTDTFDATTVDSTTVLFGATGTEAVPVQSALEDVDGDGDTDMILHFNTQDTGIQCGDTSASLTGETFGGQAIEGSDSINTVGC